MKRSSWIIGIALWTAASAGCVERRYVINSDPPGALVLRNGQMIGQTPVDDHFVYHGKYHFTLIKDGYETQQVEERVRTPWYQYFPLDFITEVLVPFNIEEVHRFRYTLQPKHDPTANDLINRGQVLRERGKTIVPPPKHQDPNGPVPANPQGPPAAPSPETAPPPQTMPPAALPPGVAPSALPPARP